MELKGVCCPKKEQSILGGPALPRIFELQFSTFQDNINLANYKKGDWYDLSSDAVWNAIKSVGPDTTNNFDYAIFIGGRWWHADTGGNDMMIFGSTTGEMAADWSSRKERKIFDQRFWCVTCDTPV